MRSTRNLPLAAAFLVVGFALVGAQSASGCVSTDACPEVTPPVVGKPCIGDEVCVYDDTKCGGEFQCIGGTWILNSTPDPDCRQPGTGGSVSVGGGGSSEGGKNQGGSTAVGGGGSNSGGAGGKNAGGSSAGGGGANAGGSSAGGANAGGAGGGDTSAQ